MLIKVQVPKRALKKLMKLTKYSPTLRKKPLMTSLVILLFKVAEHPEAVLVMELTDIQVDSMLTLVAVVSAILLKSLRNFLVLPLRLEELEENQDQESVKICIMK